MLLNFIKLAGWQLSGVAIGWMKIFPGGNFLGGKFPGVNFPGGSFPGWELPRWDLSCVGIFFGGSFRGGNCPVGIIRVAIFQVGIFMLPYLLQFISSTRQIYSCAFVQLQLQWKHHIHTLAKISKFKVIWVIWSLFIFWSHIEFELSWRQAAKNVKKNWF